MSELPPHIPPALEPLPVQEIDHFRRFPTGGTSYVTDPKPHPPVTESSWFRRVPNGGTVNRPPSRTGIFTTSDVAPRLIAAPPERPNGGGTIYRPSNADASGDEGGSGGENGDK